jgi:hypothetical protein
LGGSKAQRNTTLVLHCESRRLLLPALDFCQSLVTYHRVVAFARTPVPPLPSVVRRRPVYAPRISRLTLFIRYYLSHSKDTTLPWFESRPTDAQSRHKWTVTERLLQTHKNIRRGGNHTGIFYRRLFGQSINEPATFHSANSGLWLASDCMPVSRTLTNCLIYTTKRKPVLIFFFNSLIFWCLNTGPFPRLSATNNNTPHR